MPAWTNCSTSSRENCASPEAGLAPPPRPRPVPEEAPSPSPSPSALTLTLTFFLLGASSASPLRLAAFPCGQVTKQLTQYLLPMPHTYIPRH